MVKEKGKVWYIKIELRIARPRHQVFVSCPFGILGSVISVSQKHITNSLFLTKKSLGMHQDFLNYKAKNTITHIGL